jgi:hypothetical protein
MRAGILHASTAPSVVGLQPKSDDRSSSFFSCESRQHESHDRHALNAAWSRNDFPSAVDDHMVVLMDTRSARMVVNIFAKLSSQSTFIV